MNVTLFLLFLEGFDRQELHPVHLDSTAVFAHRVA